MQRYCQVVIFRNILFRTACAAFSPPDSDLYQPSFPIYEGIWHGERDRLLFLQGQILDRPDLAAWAYYEAGIELELYRTEAFFKYSWLYSLGDERPNWMRIQDLQRPPAPPLIPAEIGRGAPPVKSAPRGLGIDTQAAATNQLLLANQVLRQQQQQDAAEAAQREAEREHAIEAAI